MGTKTWYYVELHGTELGWYCYCAYDTYGHANNAKNQQKKLGRKARVIEITETTKVVST